MKGALPLLALLGGCALRDARVTSASCANDGQCARSDVCFLGECRPTSAANLSVVRVEVRPPGGSPLGLRRLQLDLAHSVLNDVALAVTLNVGDPATPGSVTQAQDAAPATPVVNAILTFSDAVPVIPDRVEQVVTTTDTSGAYRARIAQGTWKVVVQPPLDGGVALPPIRFGVLDTSAPVLGFVVPATTSLPQLDGCVTVNDGGAALAGAAVTAVDGSGTAVSAPAITGLDGGYSLYLAPDAGPVALQIGPAADADAGGLSGSPEFGRHSRLGAFVRF